jgi:UDP-glucose 4-epimerase
MKLLLTGALGNVGSHTLPELLRRGHEVRCLVRSTPANRRRAKALTGGSARAEIVWGDLTDPDAVHRAAEGTEVVIHLAAVIPPLSEEDPAFAERINVGGTANIIAASLAASAKLIFSSTLDVHGHTPGLGRLRQVDDPLIATDAYSGHKIEAERLIRASGLTFAIFRLADVPVLALRKAHPIMFSIGLHNRIESVHADDAGLALANALETPAIWGRTFFIGGGASCQLTYGDYLTRLLAAMGLRPLPDNAFSTNDYATDWLDTTESEALLHYQRHSFDDIAQAIAATLGWRRHLLPLAAPVARSAMLRLSPHHRQAG